jgi:ADP-heptose:LPS heptosyltransferase
MAGERRGADARASGRLVAARDLFQRLQPDARLLLIRLRSMGDCLLLTSPVRALKAEFPGFRISVLAEARFADCFDGNPDVEEILAVRSKTSAAARLSVRRFEAIVNLHGGPSSTAFALMARGPRIGGEHYQYRGLYGGLFPRPDPGRHTVEAVLGMFGWLGLRAASPPPMRYEPHPEAAASVRARAPAGAYAVLHPAAVLATKRWAADRFGAVARWLRGQGLAIVVTCGPGEEAVLAAVARVHQDATGLSGLSIPELAELIRGARLFVGNDSGPMHLAAAVGTPTVAVWGSSDSGRWRPWDVEHRVVQNPFACNPCPGYRCLVASSPLCIESVTVDQVQAAAQALLERPEAG